MERYSITIVNNGYILSKSEGLGAYSIQWVFNTPEDLGKWITNNIDKCDTQEASNG